MSLLLPDSSVASTNHLQIWDNAAFDDGGSASKTASSPLPPHAPLQPVSANICDPVDLDPAKENRSPASAKAKASPQPPKKFPSRVAFRVDATEIEEDEGIDDEIARIEGEIARLRSRLEVLRIKKAERAAAGRSRGRIVPAKFLEPKQGPARNPCTPASRKIDRSLDVAPASAGFRRRCLSLGPLEILATPVGRLEPLRSATRILWPSALKKKPEESPALRTKVDRRGLSLGPLEIHESLTLNQSGNANETPLGSVQSCKKTGLQKLEGIEEEKEVTKERERNLNPKPQTPSTAKRMARDTKKAAETPANARIRRRGVSIGPAEIAASARSSQPNNLQRNKEKAVEVDKPTKRSSSMSPKSKQPSVAKASETNKVISARAKKSAMEVQSSGSIGPKALFHEGENAVSCKRPSKTPKMRAVASRYSLSGARGAGAEPGSKRRKWSLSELNREKTRLSLTGSSGSMPDCKRSQASELEDEMNLDLQIPDNLDVEPNLPLIPDNLDVEANLPSVAHSSPSSIMKVTDMLPKIKILRSNFESPRDSGCAKRAADLVGRKSFFAVAEGEDLNSPCHALSFDKDE